MPCFTHAEGTAVDGEFGDLAFFAEGKADEQYFPSYEKISLELEEADIEMLLHMMTAAETVAGAFGQGVTISTNHDIAYRIDITADEDDAFRAEVHEIEFWVSGGNPAQVRWNILNEYSEDKILTNWISRAELEAMKSGVVPTSN